MKLRQLDKLFEEGKYEIITAPTGSGKTREIALLALKRLAEPQAQEETILMQNQEILKIEAK